MDKKKTLREREAAFENLKDIDLSELGFHEIDPRALILDKKRVVRAIIECLTNNDPEGVMEVLQTYFETLQKAQILQKSQLPKTTYYNALRLKNPTLKTFAKMVSAVNLGDSDTVKAFEFMPLKKKSREDRYQIEEEQLVAT